MGYICIRAQRRRWERMEMSIRTYGFAWTIMSNDDSNRGIKLYDRYTFIIKCSYSSNR